MEKQCTWRRKKTSGESQDRHVGEDTYDLAKSSVESFFITKKYKDTIHRRNKRPILRYFLTMMLM
ncbi:hypothetical protein T03_1961 [Trichinella britovi]|uniref:Uncharacterized protein n=1 Tax=Trichinella britovi TaxID=45882 RepID=A0A0V1AXF1_TRIBR|nr:hypothetical protein T03_1961 [Trichinella britovi]